MKRLKMIKEKESLSIKIKHLFTCNIWLKIVSLILAVMIWFFVQGQVYQGRMYKEQANTKIQP